MYNLAAATDALRLSLLNHLRIFRSGTMAETFGLNGVDRMLAGAGRQNISFSFDGGVLKQRIDRFHDVSRVYFDQHDNNRGLRS